MSVDGLDWYLINASPDIRTQLLRTPELAPSGRRHTPIRGVVLTSAELDHTLGLVSLREATDLTVHAPSTVLDALPWRDIIQPYGGFRWEPVPRQLGDHAVEAVPVSGKKPRYAAGPDAVDWAVAYRLGGLVYAPCLPEWSDAFDALLDGATWVLLDGSFWTDDELERVTGVRRTAREMGHLPIEESLAHRSDHPDVRWIYTHLNNTNPVLDPCSPERQILLAVGAELAEDGSVLQ